ncbi:MAG: response regulator transcription factor [Acidobacteria bacterium]|nr:response regulator transcription factor [Acidobacteriota bacterium]
MPGPVENQGTLSVCVVEYHPLAARHLELLLQRDPELELIPRDRLLEHPLTRPATIAAFVVDQGSLPMPLNRFLRFLGVRFPKARALVLDDALSDDDLCRLLFLGIHGFLAYEEVEANLVPAVRAVADGHYWVPQRVLEQYMQFSARLPAPREDRGEPFTWRERRIIELVKRRLSNKEISAILSVSEGTVKFHLSNIFAKLGVRDRHHMIEVTSGHPHPLPQKPK